jgi:hypothetical protein
MEQHAKMAWMFHIPSDYVVEDASTHRKPPEVRIGD